MADIFISYVREDVHRAERLAQAFEALDWSVWWDRSIPVGRAFDEVIEEEIAKASCIVVLWSPRSVGSRWVRTEAAEGADRNVLVPIKIDDCRVPLAFKRIQTADLTSWNGASDASEFQALASDVSRFLKKAPVALRGEAVSRHGAQPSFWTSLSEGNLRRTVAFAAMAVVLAAAAWLGRDMFLSRASDRSSGNEIDASFPPAAASVTPSLESLFGIWRGQVKSGMAGLTNISTAIELRIGGDGLSVQAVSPSDECEGRLELSDEQGDGFTFQYSLVNTIRGQCFPGGTVMLSPIDGRSMSYVFRGVSSLLPGLDLTGTLRKAEE